MKSLMLAYWYVRSRDSDESQDHGGIGKRVGATRTIYDSSIHSSPIDMWYVDVAIGYGHQVDIDLGVRVVVEA